MRSKRPARPAFTSPPFREGFNHLVWEVVAEIPKGKVATYGQIASMVPRPAGVRARHYRAARARWVGQAMAGCPDDLPWHRVINAQGGISLRSGNDHHIVQRRLLEVEGVVFDKSAKVDLDRFLWDPVHLQSVKPQRPRLRARPPKET